MTKLFAKAVGPAGKVYALDTDSQAISILRHQTRGTNIETIMGDISQETVIEASSLDMIYIATVLHSFTRQQLQEFIREVKRLLKPDGVLAVVEIVKQETPFGPPLSMRYSPEELKALVPLKAENTVAVAEHFYMQVFRHHPKFTNKSDR
jgi:ubiquinone/menaquinone biosynthesis C-methylase UbiE